MTQYASSRVYIVFLLVLVSFIKVSTAQGQQLVREGDASAGAISRVALATNYKGLMVTAVRDGGGNLKLIAWKVSGNPQGNIAGVKFIERKGDASAGPVSQLAVLYMGSHRFVTAVRTATGNLKLIAWQISEDGLNIVRKGNASAGPIGEVAMASLKPTRFVTAVRDGSGNLKLIVWDISPDGQSIVRKGDASAGAANKVSVVSTGPPGTGVVTAVRDSGGNLKLIAWRISDDAQVVRKGDASAGAISEIASTWMTQLVIPYISDEVVTAVRDGSGNLKVISWHISGGQDQPPIVRKGDSSAGAISKVAATRVETPMQTHRLITAVSAGNGDLKLIAWNTTSSGEIVREGEASAGAVSEMAVTSVWGRYLVTAVRAGNGDLKLIGWKHSGP